MNKRSIFELLNEFETKIQHQTQATTRAHDLEALLEIELKEVENTRSADILMAALTTIDAVNFGRLELDLKLAIALLQNFLRLNNWSLLITAEDPFTVERYDKIRFRLQSIVGNN